MCKQTSYRDATWQKIKTEFGTRDIPLNWEVFVTPSIAVVISDLPSGVKQPHNAWQRMG